jgi:hypothetical protein
VRSWSFQLIAGAKYAAARIFRFQTNGFVLTEPKGIEI